MQSFEKSNPNFTPCDSIDIEAASHILQKEESKNKGIFLCGKNEKSDLWFVFFKTDGYKFYHTYEECIQNRRVKTGDDKQYSHCGAISKYSKRYYFRQWYYS